MPSSRRVWRQRSGECFPAAQLGAPPRSPSTRVSAGADESDDPLPNGPSTVGASLGYHKRLTADCGPGHAQAREHVSLPSTRSSPSGAHPAATRAPLPGRSSSCQRTRSGTRSRVKAGSSALTRYGQPLQQERADLMRPDHRVAAEGTQLRIENAQQTSTLSTALLRLRRGRGCHIPGSRSPPADARWQLRRTNRQRSAPDLVVPVCRPPPA